MRHDALCRCTDRHDSWATSCLKAYVLVDTHLFHDTPTMATLGAPPEWQNVIRARLMAQQAAAEPLKDVIEQCTLQVFFL